MDTLPWGHLQYSKYLHSLFKIMISLEPNVCLVSRDLSTKIHFFSSYKYLISLESQNDHPRRGYFWLLGIFQLRNWGFMSGDWSMPFWKFLIFLEVTYLLNISKVS